MSLHREVVRDHDLRHLLVLDVDRLASWPATPNALSASRAYGFFDFQPPNSFSTCAPIAAASKSPTTTSSPVRRRRSPCRTACSSPSVTLLDRRDLLGRAPRVARVALRPRARRAAAIVVHAIDIGSVSCCSSRASRSCLTISSSLSGNAGDRQHLGRELERRRQVVAQRLDVEREAVRAAVDRDPALQLVLEVLQVLVALLRRAAREHRRRELARSSTCSAATSRRPSAARAGARPCRRASSSAAAPP